MPMKTVYIVVRDGRVNEVYADEDMSVEIIDFDTQDPDEYDEAEEYYNTEATKGTKKIY